MIEHIVGFEEACQSIGLDIDLAVTKHAAGHPCSRCSKTIIGEGYAPRFVIKGKPGGFVGPAMDTHCLCLECAAYT